MRRKQMVKCDLERNSEIYSYFELGILFIAQNQQSIDWTKSNKSETDCQTVILSVDCLLCCWW